MKKTRLIVALLMAMLLIFTFALTACPDEGDGDDGPTAGVPNATINADGSVDYNFAENTKINMALGYEKQHTSITYKGLPAPVVLPTGTYSNGQLKPAWAELESRLGVTFSDSYSGKNRGNEFDHWQGANYTDTTNGDIDILMGTLDRINEAGRAGELLNLADYLDYMPNFQNFLEANPVARMSLVGDTDDGSIYTIPYFDGNDDQERFFMMRVDWVAQLLDGATAFTSSKTAKAISTVGNNYEAYMPTTDSIDVEVAKADGSGTVTIEKNYDDVLAHFKTTYPAWYSNGTSGNIVDISKAYRASTGATFVGLVNILREYIDVAYTVESGSSSVPFYSTRSDLFCGVNGAWDADEMVVLLQCVVGNGYEFNDDGNVVGIFSRDTARTDRRYDVIRMGAHLFGVRGIESRSGYLYYKPDGKIADARQEFDAYEMSMKLNSLYEDNLIDQNYINSTSTQSKAIIQGNKGFMMYDYVQTQTILNTADTHLQPVLTPVALWQDGTEDGVYMRFTESWRSVKSDGSAVVASVANDADLLAAVLCLVDYFFSEEGQILMTYGPDAFIEQNSDGTFKTIDYNGVQYPQISTKITSPTGDFYFNSAALNHADAGDAKVNGSYSTYARAYIGSTLCMGIKMQSFEMQLTDANGRAGEEKVATAIGLGLVKHPMLRIDDDTNPNNAVDWTKVNWWYVSLPTTIPTLNAEDLEIAAMANISGSSQYFSQTNGEYNLFIAMVTSTITTGSETYDLKANSDGQASVNVTVSYYNIVLKSNAINGTYGMTAFRIYDQATLAANPAKANTSDTVKDGKVALSTKVSDLITILKGTGKTDWKGATYLKYMNDAWTRQLEYYKGLLG